MGAFLFMVDRGHMLYRINRYHYIDKKVQIKFEIFARKVELADELAKRISIACKYNLRRKKLFFSKEVYAEIPPYELEQAQLEYVEDIEEISKNN